MSDKVFIDTKVLVNGSKTHSPVGPEQARERPLTLPSPPAGERGLRQSSPGLSAL